MVKAHHLVEFETHNHLFSRHVLYSCAISIIQGEFAIRLNLMLIDKIIPDER